MFSIAVLLFALSWVSIEETAAQQPHNVIRILVNTTDANTLYALDESLGVFKSADRGNTWVEMNNGLDQLPNILPPAIHPEFFTELVIVPTSPNVLYTVKNWLIYKSSDGGEPGSSQEPERKAWST